LLYRAAAAVLLVLSLGTFPIGVGSYSSAQVVSQSFTSVADAFVSSSKPNTNFGNAPRLKVDKSPVLTAYVKFDVGNLTEPVQRATLQVYTRTSSSVGIDVRSVSNNSWTEKSITYANAPAFSSTSAGSSGPTQSGTWAAIDVTPLVTGTGPFTIAVTTSSMSELDADSRQTGRGPKLTLETAGGDVSAPTVPANLAATSATPSSLSVSWAASTDDTAVTGYDVFLNGTKIGSATNTDYTFGSLTCATNYTVGIEAYDAAGNHSPRATLDTSTSACPSAADTQPPSTPTGLAASGVTPTSVTLSWQASTDDTGVAGYDVYLNGSKVGSTTTVTNYSFGSLTCGTKYTLGVEAYDAAGNRSTRASLDATTGACPDTQPPSAPTSLAAAGATQTSLSLSWSASTDNVGVTGYDLYSNGVKVGSTAGTNYAFSGLTCGTIYTLGVAAYDAAGNRSTRSSVGGSTAACTAPPGSTPTFRYAYFGDSDPTANKNLGATLIDVGSKSSADALPAGLQGMVWVGDYDNSSCNWQTSDSSLSSTVTAARGDAKVFVFFFSDEPNPLACPNAPAQHKARSALIHSVDPNTKTFFVLDSNGFSGNLTQDAIDQIPLWVGTADFIGLDPYPCLVNKSCNYTFISNTIAKADATGIPYVGVLQLFDGTGAGEQFRQPTASELQTMVNLWKASHEVGSAYFAWDWPAANWYLKDHPDLESVIQSFYTGNTSADTTPPTAPSGLTKSAATATSVSLSWTPSTDNVSVTGYDVYNGSTLAGTTTSTAFTVGSLACGTSYTFGVAAKDAAGNVSTRSTLSASTSACSTSDTTPPTAPSGLKSTGATTTSLSVSWTASTDNVGVAGYGAYLNGSLIGSTAQTSYGFSGLTCGTSYTAAVDAYDATGNRSQSALLVLTTTSCADTLPPTAPGTPTVTGATATNLALWWAASLDNVGVAGYDLYSNGVKVGSTPGTQYTFSGLTCGTSYTLGVAAYDSAGNRSARSSVTGSTTACAAGTSDPVVTAAGDICASTTDCGATEKLLESIAPTRVLTLGDNAYLDGSSSDYSSYYDPNWGKQKSKTSPAPGNHDYHTAGAPGYFGYFGSQAPAPYYSFDLGSWHLISLNGELSASSGSAQETWLKNDLAAHPAQCVLAYWHEPRFSSGAEHGSDSYYDPFWRDLYTAGADVVLNGHDHDYERFAPQNPSGAADAKGIREFVVGTGGASHYTFGTPIANSVVRDNTSFGVLKLTLHASSYDWQFVPVAGASFTDAGSGTC